jgi:DNA-binding NarL/FixJ family response regulator
MATVLIVDDKKWDVEHLIEAIEFRGHSVVYYSYSQIAQKVLSEGSLRPDCAIYDMMMPRYENESKLSAELGGLLLVRETQRKSPNTRMVIHTSGLEGALKETVYKLGVPVFIKNDNDVGGIIKMLGL